LPVAYIVARCINNVYRIRGGRGDRHRSIDLYPERAIAASSVRQPTPRDNPSLPETKLSTSKTDNISRPIATFADPLSYKIQQSLFTEFALNMTKGGGFVIGNFVVKGSCCRVVLSVAWLLGLYSQTATESKGQRR